ncbi:MFS transporter [Kutzneria sp. CA-103260]|uniref:MFS transporter n=1 Tax=Kutzneria sp. CA-103260 TaxID=2802641 RepID=UPI001BADA834|nr:MFS transporter [Kutzneria sp. CA-103260]QUQ65417.1 Multidrug resistance protein MdtH [Kutzneria sp. CA-103260]
MCGSSGLARRLGHRDLILATLVIGLSTTATFMILPLLAIFLVDSRGMPVQLAGLSITTLVLTQRGGSFISGIASDRYSPRRMMVLGFALCALGYGALTMAGGVPLVMVAMAIAGVGGALFLPASKAVLAQYSEKFGRKVFVLRTTATNAGASVGPLLGGVLYREFDVALGISSALFLVCLSLCASLRPVRRLGDSSLGVFERASAVLKNRRMIVLMTTSVGFWICFSQFTLTVPLYASESFDTKGMVGLLTTLNAVVIIALQYPLLAPTMKRVDSMGRLLGVGMAIMAVAFFALVWVRGTPGLLLFTVLFSLAELVVAPCLDAAAQEAAPREQQAAYLGFISVGWAVGAVAGNLIGIELFSIGGALGGHAVSWLFCGAVALTSACVFAMCCGTKPQQLAALPGRSIRKGANNHD